MEYKTFACGLGVARGSVTTRNKVWGEREEFEIMSVNYLR
jgi:hypothetical protein